MSERKIAILIPTFPKYRFLAEHTAHAIRRYWKNSPDLFFAGCHGPRTEGWLVCLDETAPWIKILQEALHQLVDERGYDQVYLILDDHPPLDFCHSDHLNTTLPSLMRELDATFIGLLGCDQGQGRVGEKLDRSHYQMERMDSSFPYLFSLHPGLWNGKRLLEILQWTEKYALESDKKLSPWTFEKTVQENPYLPLDYKKSCYRVCGSQMVESPRKWRSIRRRWKWRMMAKAIGINLFPDLEHWYEGPYPHIWSGIMRGGQISDLYERVLRRFSDKEAQKAFDHLNFK
ncbi:MAG: hypothetical protein V4507_05405 [Verrucomicrobiota bacterium]